MLSKVRADSLQNTCAPLWNLSTAGSKKLIIVRTFVSCQDEMRKVGKRNTYRILERKSEGNRLLEDMHVGERIILRWILEF
jgi:hypothetical protein